jgi:nucleotide-binding universal stress UspA family protein
MLKRILVGLGDLDHSRSATFRAIELARHHEAELTGVTLFDSERLDATGMVPLGAGAAAKDLGESRLESASQIIAAATAMFRDKCTEANVPHAVIHEVGDPLSSLAAHARYHDLMVCGLQGLFEHGVIAEPHDEFATLIREGVRPLIVVTREHRPVRRVLIAYSGSMESAKTMRRFVQSELYRDAKLRIVTFHNEPAIGEHRLTPAAEYCRAHGLDPSLECVAALPQDELLPYADRWKADLIVMGNSAKNLLLRQILGETALHVMRNADRPLFLSQ